MKDENSAVVEEKAAALGTDCSDWIVYHVSADRVMEKQTNG